MPAPKQIAPFGGWPREALAFYEGLAEDNSRAYFDAHRKVYEQAVRRPMEELLEEVFDDYGEGKVFRPNRDTRFSKDKAPYKLAIGALVGDGYYVQLSADGLMCGGGFYELSRDQLARYRAAVEDDRRGGRLLEVREGLRAAGLELLGEELKRAPKGYDPEHPRIDLLRHKRLYALREWKPAGWLHKRDARKRVLDTWEAVTPLVRWLQAEVGPPQDRTRA